MKTNKYWKLVTNHEQLKKQFTQTADKIALMWLYVTEGLAKLWLQSTNLFTQLLNVIKRTLNSITSHLTTRKPKE